MPKRFEGMNFLSVSFAPVNGRARNTSIRSRRLTMAAEQRVRRVRRVEREHNLDHEYYPTTL